MKLQFDGSQSYQLEAIAAVVDCFAGQAEHTGFVQAMDLVSTLHGNRLSLEEAAVLRNAQAVQARHGLVPSPSLATLGEGETAFANFSVEMETGTGKTYVYLRTIFELHAKYGWSKFIIVVPSVPIREGVLTSWRVMAEHFRALYGNVAAEAWVYDSKQLTRVRQFAMGNTLQLMVMNIDAFNKSTAVINIENDRMAGRKPLEFIQEARPIVVMDEPQNMETPIAKAAIASLHPLFARRYSATHRALYQQLYRLTPVDAYDRRLVKRIEVSSILDEPDFNGAYVALKSIKASKTKITAKIEIEVNGKSGPRREMFTVASPRHRQDLFELSGGRSAYKGWIIEELSYEHRRIGFSNGVEVNEGQATGARPDEVMRAQIVETVREHFEKELALQKKPLAGGRMKVLSLFFIDRVANYAHADGKIRLWFEATYQELAAQPKYAPLKPLPVDKVHNGYFAQTKGIAKDSSGTTLADDEAYELIMRDKERLLSLDEPLRFIFSHSALREGWDNPNVFQICTLAESKSEIKKRQEIGRGMRLPVMENGARCLDERVNRLTVIANESYSDFAQALQNEIEADCGVSFASRVANAKARKRVNLKAGWTLNEDFKALWAEISQRTRYALAFSTPALIQAVADELKKIPPLKPGKLLISKAAITLTDEGAGTTQLFVRENDKEYRNYPVPDLCAAIGRETELTRSSIAQMLLASGRLPEIKTNPQAFLGEAVRIVRQKLREQLVSGIKYERVAGEAWDQMLFESEELYCYLNDCVTVTNSVYEETVFDSEIERQFASEMSGREDIKLCIKLPSWFLVETPIGTYNPDWAIVMEHERKVYLVRETKGTRDVLALAPDERDKVLCGAKHFAALGVDFSVVTAASQVR